MTLDENVYRLPESDCDETALAVTGDQLVDWVLHRAGQEVEADAVACPNVHELVANAWSPTRRSRRTTEPSKSVPTSAVDREPCGEDLSGGPLDHPRQDAAYPAVWWDCAGWQRRVGLLKTPAAAWRDLGCPELSRDVRQLRNNPLHMDLYAYKRAQGRHHMYATTWPAFRVKCVVDGPMWPDSSLPAATRPSYRKPRRQVVSIVTASILLMIALVGFVMLMMITTQHIPPMASYASGLASGLTAAAAGFGLWQARHQALQLREDLRTAERRLLLQNETETPIYDWLRVTLCDGNEPFMTGELHNAQPPVEVGHGVQTVKHSSPSSNPAGSFRGWISG
jgi:hypothetical protein